MTLRTRRILYITCILIFLTAAPLLTLYTAGYRFDFKYWRLRETGSLVVKSQPAGAAVVLAGKTYTDKTPLIINNILPGGQLLQVAKDGYRPWRKQVVVSPRVTTFEENIRLFPDAKPQPAAAEPVDYYAWNKAGDKLIFRETGGRVRLLNALNNKYETIATATATAGQIEVLWSPHDNRFLLIKRTYGSVNYWLSEAGAGAKLIPLSQITNKKITKLSWDPNAPDALYLLSSGALWRLSIPLKKERLVASSILDWRVEAKRILLLEKGVNKNKGYVSVRPLAGEAPAQLLTAVPAAGQEFMAANSHRLALYHKKTKTLLILDPLLRSENRPDAIIALSPVTEAQWSPDGQKLIYSDGYGIYEHYFAPASGSESAAGRRLIVRYSTPVSGIFPLSPDQSRLLYSVNNSLRVIELGSESEPRITVLLDNIKTMNEPQFLSGRQIFTFIDDGGYLLALPLVGQNGRGGLFGGQ